MALDFDEAVASENKNLKIKLQVQSKSLRHIL